MSLLSIPTTTTTTITGRRTAMCHKTSNTAKEKCNTIMASKTHHRSESPTGVALSNSEFKKLFTPSRDDETPPHYATYSRLQAKELLQSMEIVRRNVAVVQEEKKSECHISSVPTTSSPRFQPTLRAPTVKQNIHRMLLWPKYMLLNCIYNICEAVWILLRDLW